MGLLSELPIEWDLSGGGSYFQPEEVSFLKFLCLSAFREYEPGSLQSFEERVVNWLNNLDDEEDQKAFLGLLLELFFVGQKEFRSLYRYLYGSVIARWVIDVVGLQLSSPDLDQNILNSVNKAWICPITDSLRINAFLKVNNLQSRSIRPDWKSLLKLGDPEKIRKFVNDQGITQLILIEDFVGSGTQVADATKFAAETLPEVDILLAPLIVCPDGSKKLTNLAKNFANVTYCAGMTLPESTKFPTKPGAGTDLQKRCQDIFNRIESRLNLKKHESVTGFKNTGAQIVMYSNCPNNTLPVYHKDNDKWVSLFHRVERVQ